MENLIDSLNTAWIGKLRLHVNIARFDRNKGFSPNQTFTKKHKPDVKKHEPAASTSVKRGAYNSQSFVNVVKGVSNGEKMDNECKPMDDSPTVIISQDDDNELELALIGSETASSNMKEFYHVAKNEEEGSVDKSSNAECDNDKEDEVESVGEFFDNDGNETHFNKDEENMVAKYIVYQPTNSDTFELESLIAKNGNYQKQGSTTPKFPLGFTQSDGGDIKRDLSDVCKPVSRENGDETSVHYESKSMQPEDEVTKKHVGVSMIQQVEDTIKVGTALGFNMEGCQDMLAKMIADMGDKVETKMLRVDPWTLRQVGDRFGTVFNEKQTEVFNSFINNMNLFDVPLGGFRITWTNKWALKMSKLDRFLATEGFHDSFPNITGFILEKGIPDHRPILLKESVVDYGPTPFRFFHSWLDCEGLFDLVVDTWKAFDSGESNGMISIKKKLQNLKQVIHAWSTSKKLSDNQIKKEHQSRLSLIDAKVDQGVATRDDLNCRISSMKILSDIDRKEASDIAQKAKVKWAIEGVENTSFFHSSLKKKRRQCAIKGILHNGVWIDDPGEVKSEFYNHFCNRFSCTDGTHPTVGDVPFNQISVEQCEFLERDVSNEEIKKAVWDSGGDRAPGPDGFTFMFFKTFWEVIQNDVVQFVQEFFQSACFPKGCNSSFIALIPKVEDAKLVSDFRPISLIGFQYKIIGKLLANRLSMVIGNCVSFEQSTFIKGRNVLDGPLVLNECMAWYRKRKKALMVFKVHFEKAFDSLRCDYLDATMASILVNGSPTSEFELSKGLRQGDPMSPFLFILAIEGLHVMVSKAVNTGLYKGASIGHGSMNISHLLYVDDAIFVGEWSHFNAYNLICLLRCFYMVSGLKINVHKSKLLGVNVPDEEVSNMALVIGCGIAMLPMMYLGVLVGCNMGRCDYWKRIVQKFESKMSQWKATLLSVGGRLSLIKAILGIHGIDGGIGSSRAGKSTHSP
ncbi:putative RNA-directed DNA polymerase, eukaryota, reverse transcriptase zinc-binding domain protein [Tanacetum coccineum]